MQLCGFEVGLNRPFILLAGPCVIESEQLTLDIAGKMKEITDKLGIPYDFQGKLRQSESFLRYELPRSGYDQRSSYFWKKSAVRSAFRLSPMFIRPMKFRKLPLWWIFFRRRLSFAVRQTLLPPAQRAVSRSISRKVSFLAPQDMKQVVLKARHAAAAAGLSEDRFMVVSAAPVSATTTLYPICAAL